MGCTCYELHHVTACCKIVTAVIRRPGMVVPGRLITITTYCVLPLLA